MSIGGVDVVFRAPADEAVGDIILRRCARLWPQSVFQAGNEQQVRGLDDPWVWQVGTASPEFFVYRDRKAAQSWDDEGATRANRGSMLYFIVRPAENEAPHACEVTLVCGGLAPGIRQLIQDLRSSFLFLRSGSFPREAA